MRSHLWAFLELDSTKNVSLSIWRPKVRNSNWSKYALPTKHWYFVLLVLGSRMDNCHFVHQKVRLWLLKQKFAFFHKRELANTYLMIIFSKKIMSRLKVYFSSWAKLWFWGIRNVARLPRFQGFVWKVSGSWENRCTVRYLFIFQILVKWHVSIFSFGKSFNFGVQNAFWKCLRFWGYRNILNSNISQGNFLRVPGVWEILCTVRYLSATRKKETINQICSQNKAECWTH